MRERGQTAEAEQLRVGELAELVAAARTSAETDLSVAQRLDALFIAETERVANAAVLAELLAPLLSGQMPAAGSSSAERLATPAALPTISAPKPAPARGGSIADFIDEMIAQEKPAPVLDPDARRRAS